MLKKWRAEDAPMRQQSVRLNWRITHEVFNQVMMDPEVQRMMDDLEISVSNRDKLFDVLDSDSSGSLDVAEIIQGLMKLRGPADKGDVVSALLTIRTLHKSFQAFEKGCIAEQKSMGNSQIELQAAVKQLQEQFQALHLESLPF